MRINRIVKLFCLISFLIVQGCKSINNDEFYNEIINKDYGLFIGKSLFIRDFNRGNPIIFLFDYSKSYKPCASIIFTADSKNYKILESKILRYDDTCKLQPTRNDTILVQSFLKLNLRRLMVKNNGNIYISTVSPQHNDIVKILVIDDTASDYKNWRKFPHHWFVKPVD